MSEVWTLDRKKAADALASGLAFLAGKAGLAAVEWRTAGYSVGQLKDETRKWILPADDAPPRLPRNADGSFSETALGEA